MTWWTRNVREMQWRANELGSTVDFDYDVDRFEEFGINLTVLEPGETGLYHAEENQEAFLVLSGECVLLVESEERRLLAWDFFHAPRGPSTPSSARARGRA